MNTLINIALTILTLASMLSLSAIMITFGVKISYELITELVDDIRRKRKDKIHE